MDNAASVSTLLSSNYLRNAKSIVKFNNTWIVSCPEDHALFEVDLNDNEVKLFAGQREESGYKESFLLESRFKRPEGLAVHPKTGDLYISDTDNHCIRRVLLKKQKEVGLFAGKATFNSGKLEGNMKEVVFNYPKGIVFDRDGNNLFVADCGACTIKKINMKTEQVTQLGENADSLMLKSPRSLSIDYFNNLFIACEEGIQLFTKNSKLKIIAGYAASSDYVQAYGEQKSKFDKCSIVSDYFGTLLVINGSQGIRKITTLWNGSDFFSVINDLTVDKDDRIFNNVVCMGLWNKDDGSADVIVIDVDGGEGHVKVLSNVGLIQTLNFFS